MKTRAPTGATRGGGDLFRVASAEWVPISDPLGTHSKTALGASGIGTHSGDDLANMLDRPIGEIA